MGPAREHDPRQSSCILLDDLHAGAASRRNPPSRYFCFSIVLTTSRSKQSPKIRWTQSYVLRGKGLHEVEEEDMRHSERNCWQRFCQPRMSRLLREYCQRAVPSHLISAFRPG
eukprot:331474-Pleurochrysis_carterae.AAC.1